MASDGELLTPPQTMGEAVIDAVIFTGCIQAIFDGKTTIFVWDVNAAEQIEARLNETGWMPPPDVDE